MSDEAIVPHELVYVFAENNMPLSDTLVEMLNEHYSHRSERRGCGYTQASRVLAAQTNQKRDDNNTDDLKLFARSTKAIQQIMNLATSEHLNIHSWRNLDLRQDLVELLQDKKRCTQNPTFFKSLAEEILFQKTLRTIHKKLKLEESKLIVDILIDIILPKNAQQERLSSLIALPEKIAIGSCTLAEKFFLNIAYNVIPRRGRVNIIVDEHNTPLLIEKLAMGDSHSCITVNPVMMNGVRIPIGSLFAVKYNEQNFAHQCKNFKGNIIPLSACNGFRFLRLTTLAVSPQNRARAFTRHFEWQGENGLFSHHSTQINQLISIAQEQL